MRHASAAEGEDDPVKKISKGTQLGAVPRRQRLFDPPVERSAEDSLGFGSTKSSEIRRQRSSRAWIEDGK
eukprot:Skav211598  [mRNA]  locus=scaffold2962:77694:78321:- [translate_table: standard]